MKILSLFALALIFFVNGGKLKAEVHLYSGVNQRGDVCSIKLETNEWGDIIDVSVDGLFIVNYHIPTPFSRLYGEYYMEQSHSFPSEGKIERYYVTEPFELNKRILSNDLILSTSKSANPNSSNYDASTTFYKIVLDRAVDQLISYQYKSRTKIKKILPFVSADMKCTDLQHL